MRKQCVQISNLYLILNLSQLRRFKLFWTYRQSAADSFDSPSIQHKDCKVSKIANIFEFHANVTIGSSPSPLSLRCVRDGASAGTIRPFDERRRMSHIRHARQVASPSFTREVIDAPLFLGEPTQGRNVYIPVFVATFFAETTLRDTGVGEWTFSVRIVPREASIDSPAASSTHRKRVIPLGTGNTGWRFRANVDDHTTLPAVRSHSRTRIIQSLVAKPLGWAHVSNDSQKSDMKRMTCTWAIDMSISWTN